MYLFEIHVVWASSAQDRKPMTVEMTACQSIFPFLLTIEALEAFTRPSKLKRPTKQLPPWLMMKKSLPLSSTTVSLSSVVLGAWRSSDRGPMRRREPAVTVTRFAFGLSQPSVTLLTGSSTRLVCGMIPPWGWFWKCADTCVCHCGLDRRSLFRPRRPNTCHGGK